MALKFNAATLISILSLGGIALTYVCRQKLTSFVWNIQTRRLLKKKKHIFIISDSHEWERISDSFCSITNSINAVGFDCEWIQVKGKRRPVALLQLATYNGICALIRLNYLEDNIPKTLKGILENEQIMKVGVSSDLDAQYLRHDYNITVNGWADLRYLALQNSLRKTNDQARCKEKLGLEALAKQYLEKKLDKDWRVRMGDWEAQKLTKIQVDYAAEDALVGVQLLLCMLRDLWIPPLSWPPFRLRKWEEMTSEAVRHVCWPIAKKKFFQKHSDINPSFKKNDASGSSISKPMKELRMSYSTRKTPLYHNSQLWAPDGEPLCTCDPKKATWYVEKNLGQLVSENPLVVKLNFEPAGRPNREGADGQFYLQERYNICVVCGKGDSYIRKNIIPHEYRKYFPEILKSHQSHDVVLLCTDCHQLSNFKDNAFRHSLAKEFDAPIGCETDVKVSVDGKRKAVRSAGGALKKSRSQLPASRIQDLEEFLKNYFETEVLTEDLVERAADLDTQVKNNGDVPHGYKVYLHYSAVGLIRLEQRWRQWFLESMQPKYMPEKWSISHNHRKLKTKMSLYRPGHAVREHYKVALVGSEGEIDVPYLPNNMARSNFFGVSSEDNSRESTPEESPY